MIDRAGDNEAARVVVVPTVMILPDRIWSEKWGALVAITNVGEQSGSAKGPSGTVDDGDVGANNVGDWVNNWLELAPKCGGQKTLKKQQRCPDWRQLIYCDKEVRTWRGRWWRRSRWQRTVMTHEWLTSSAPNFR